MKFPFSIRVVTPLLLAASSLASIGQVQAADAGAMPMNHSEEHADADMVHGKGVVQSIDAAANTVTLSHEAIPEISWPAMTMAFKVAGDAEEQVKPGDTVEFEMVSEGASYTITKIEKAE